MSDTELRHWWRMMGRDESARAAMVRTLLRHANADEMSAEDRALCLRALALWAPQVELNGYEADVDISLFWAPPVTVA